MCPRSLQVLVDMMAGIGPFAVPAAHKGLEVGLRVCVCEDVEQL